MLLIEERARERGLSGSSSTSSAPTCRGLYRSLGYEEIAVYMGKTL